MSHLTEEVKERKDLDKFMKFFALKVSQIILQSRTGEKVITKCKPDSSGNDWFNLDIPDVPEVYSEAKKAISSDFMGYAIPFCIELSLRTAEGETMVLETWSLSVIPELSDPAIKVTYTIYNRMGVLLKSLLSVSRVTPAYKLSRKQGNDTYFFLYKVYKGKPNYENLGENYRNVKVGNLATPCGTVILAVSYRTKMTLSPTHTNKDSIMLKSDHFHPDGSPRHTRDELSKSFNGTIRAGAFAMNEKIEINEEDLVVPDVPFSCLLTPRKTRKSQTETTTDSISTTTATPPTTTQTTSITSNCNNGNDKTLTDNATSKSNSRNGSRRSSCSINSANDDFIMVELKTPFVSTHTSNDLSSFYRECASAPSLLEFAEERTLAEQIGDLNVTLETFETEIQKYDDILGSLCRSENNN